MHFRRFISLAAIVASSASIVLGSQEQYLNITATAAVNGTSAIQCWQLSTPFKTSTEAGTVGAMDLPLGNVTSNALTILPAGFIGTSHPAPAPQYVVFLSGLAEVSVPGSGSSGFVLGGADGILFAADTQALSPHGHVTKYLAKTVALEIPTLHGKIPAHKVLHAGGCTGQDLLV